jgi:rod shape-determining protein MreD
MEPLPMPVNFLRPRTLLISAIVALLGQLIIAPNIAIMGVMPDFLLVLLVVCIGRISHSASLILALILGLLNDLITGSALGATTLVYVIVALICSGFALRLQPDLLRVRLMLVAIDLVIANLLCAVVYSATGSAGGFGATLLFITLPSILYDFVAAALVMAIVTFWRNRSTKSDAGRPNLLG